MLQSPPADCPSPLADLGNTLSKLGFLLAELPSQLISKRVGPDIWIPAQIVVFSVLSGAQFFMNGRSSFLALRFMIAAFQGGFIPDVRRFLRLWCTRALALSAVC